jgi:DNA-binding LacI/PurR family transcriptional regulator
VPILIKNILMVTKPSDFIRSPTIRTIAQIARVSPMTVSLSLRNHPNAAPATRLRVQSIAAKLGYQPDPTIAKLMTHLRTRRSYRLQAAICCLTTFKHIDEQPYLNAIFQGAVKRSRELGFSMDLINVAQDGNSKPRYLERILRARGVQGVLLLPMAQSGKFCGISHWDQFSVVSSTLSVTDPVTHKVIPNAYDNLITLCNKLRELGYRKLGLVITKDHDCRVGHRFTAAMAWHNCYSSTTPVEPLISKKSLNVEFPTWFRDQKPDAIIGFSDHVLSEIESLLPSRDRGQVVLVGFTR